VLTEGARKVYRGRRVGQGCSREFAGLCQDRYQSCRPDIMPRGGFEPIFPQFEREKSSDALKPRGHCDGQCRLISRPIFPPQATRKYHKRYVIWTVQRPVISRGVMRDKTWSWFAFSILSAFTYSDWAIFYRSPRDDWQSVCRLVYRAKLSNLKQSISSRRAFLLFRKPLYYQYTDIA
jgi:hypothetical protein